MAEGPLRIFYLTEKNKPKYWFQIAALAQLVEHLICNQTVVGSIPIGSYFSSGRYSSGQRGQTVNLLTMSSKVRILPCPISFSHSSIKSNN